MLSRPRRATWLLAALPLLTTTGCTATAETAAVIEATEAAGSGSPGRLTTPGGRFQVSMSDARDSLKGDLTADGEDLDAPEGHEFRLVTWEWMEAAPFHLQAQPSAQTPTEVQLVVGDDTIDVGESVASQPDGRSWVVVPDDAKVAIQLTYDGVGQRWDPDSNEFDIDRALAYYAQPTVPLSDPVGCPPGFECSVNALRLPYLPGQNLGWAPEGSSWVVVDVTAEIPTRADTARIREAERWAEENLRFVRADAITLDGRTGKVVTEQGSTARSLVATIAYPVPDNQPSTKIAIPGS